MYLVLVDAMDRSLINLIFTHFIFQIWYLHIPFINLSFTYDTSFNQFFDFINLIFSYFISSISIYQFCLTNFIKTQQHETQWNFHTVNGPPFFNCMDLAILSSLIVPTLWTWSTNLLHCQDPQCDGYTGCQQGSHVSHFEDCSGLQLYR